MIGAELCKYPPHAQLSQISASNSRTAFSMRHISANFHRFEFEWHFVNWIERQLCVYTKHELYIFSKQIFTEQNNWSSTNRQWSSNLFHEDRSIIAMLNMIPIIFQPIMHNPVDVNEYLCFNAFWFIFIFTATCVPTCFVLHITKHNFAMTSKTNWIITPYTHAHECFVSNVNVSVIRSVAMMW